MGNSCARLWALTGSRGGGCGDQRRRRRAGCAEAAGAEGRGSSGVGGGFRGGGRRGRAAARPRIKLRWVAPVGLAFRRVGGCSNAGTARQSERSRACAVGEMEKGRGRTAEVEAQRAAVPGLLQRLHHRLDLRVLCKLLQPFACGADVISQATRRYPRGAELGRAGRARWAGRAGWAGTRAHPTHT